jgi:hypothetical protein
MRPLAFLSRRRIILTLALLLPTIPAWAADLPENRATLRGIAEIAVVVERLDPEVERDGLTQSQLETDVALRLQQSGIKLVLSSPYYLYVSLGTLKPEACDLYAFYLSVAFLQPVKLTRDPAIAYPYAATWSAGVVGTVGTQRVAELRTDVTNLVDRFINSYLGQNPKR